MRCGGLLTCLDLHVLASRPAVVFVCEREEMERERVSLCCSLLSWYVHTDVLLLSFIK